jgi:hypothetical protein
MCAKRGDAKSRGGWEREREREREGRRSRAFLGALSGRGGSKELIYPGRDNWPMSEKRKGETTVQSKGTHPSLGFLVKATLPRDKYLMPSLMRDHCHG